MISILCIFLFFYFLGGLNSGVLAQSTCPHGWLKNDNSCYLFVTHVDNDWTESEVQCTLSTPCLINDKHTGIISVIFRDSKKVYATHSEKIVSVFLSHDWIQTGRDWDRKGEQLSEKPRSIRISARYSVETSWTFRLLFFEKIIIKGFYTVTVAQS